VPPTLAHAVIVGGERESSRITPAGRPDAVKARPSAPPCGRWVPVALWLRPVLTLVGGFLVTDRMAGHCSDAKEKQLMCELTIELGAAAGYWPSPPRALARSAPPARANALDASAPGACPAVVGCVAQRRLAAGPWDAGAWRSGGGLGCPAGLPGRHEPAMPGNPVALFNGPAGVFLLAGRPLGAHAACRGLNLLVTRPRCCVRAGGGDSPASVRCGGRAKLTGRIGTPRWTLRPQRHAINSCMAVACLICSRLLLKGFHAWRWCRSPFCRCCWCVA